MTKILFTCSSWFFFSWNLKMGNISMIFPFCGFTAGTILFLLCLVSSTFYLFLNRSDAWNDDVPVLSQTLELLELNTVKFAKCLGEWAAVLSDLNVQEVIIHTKKKNISAFKIKKKSTGILEGNVFSGLFFSLLGFALCVNEVSLSSFFRKARNWFFSSFLMKFGLLTCLTVWVL